MNPTQAHILTISEKHIDYANEIASELKNAGVRVEVDTSDDTIGRKLRMHRAMRPAYILILGDEETSNGTVSYMGPDREQINGVEKLKFIEQLIHDCKSNI